jgi:hypothetical protein
VIQLDWISGAIVGVLAVAITEIPERYIMPRIRKLWPKSRSAFVDPDKYMAEKRKRGEWD